MGQPAVLFFGMMEIMNIRALPLSVSVGLCLLVGFAGAYFTQPAIEGWYQALNKPFFTPPNAIFGPVWTILYILMGVALYLVWVSKGKQKQKAITFFFIQLGLNFLWSVFFFAMENPLLALGNIIALWVVIALTIKYFYPISYTAAYLLIPYLAWVSFATILNASIFLLNR